jgi:hypothetical protein
MCSYVFQIVFRFQDFEKRPHDNLMKDILLRRTLSVTTPSTETKFGLTAQNLDVRRCSKCEELLIVINVLGNIQCWYPKAENLSNSRVVVVFCWSFCEFPAVPMRDTYPSNLNLLCLITTNGWGSIFIMNLIDYSHTNSSRKDECVNRMVYARIDVRTYESTDECMEWIYLWMDERKDCRIRNVKKS